MMFYTLSVAGIREAFMSGDHEPWVFRGGLAADLQVEVIYFKKEMHTLLISESEQIEHT